MIYYTYKGETKIVSEWAKQIGISRSGLSYRIARETSRNPNLDKDMIFANVVEKPVDKKHYVKTYEFNGQRKTLAEWAKHLNIERIVIYDRLFNKKWGIEKTLTTPVHHRKNRRKGKEIGQ